MEGMYGQSGACATSFFHPIIPFGNPAESRSRVEEKEPAAMVLEWNHPRDPTFDKELKDFLFTGKPIAYERETGRG